jgi:hypothetical protein
MHGSGMGLWPGAAGEAGILAEWSGGSADLLVGDLARPAVLLLDRGVEKSSTI